MTPIRGSRLETSEIERAVDLTVCLGGHISVADGGHGDQGPPQSERNGVEVVVRIGLDALGVVDERGEDDDAQNQEEHQQRQLLGRRPERLDQNLQTCAVWFRFQ